MSAISINTASAMLTCIGLSMIAGANLWALVEGIDPQYSVSFNVTNIISSVTVAVAAIMYRCPHKKTEAILPTSTSV